MEERMNNLLDEIEEDTQKNKFLTFSLGKELYGIDIMFVTEIVGIQPITEVPELPVFIKGIINLRGKIIPVMDARIKFGKVEQAYNDRTCIVVVDVMALSIGIIVDAVSEVMTINEENIVPPPNIGSSGRKYIKSVGKSGDEVILLLDCEKLLNEDEFMHVNNANN